MLALLLLSGCRQGGSKAAGLSSQSDSLNPCGEIEDSTKSISTCLFCKLNLLILFVQAVYES